MTSKPRTRKQKSEPELGTGERIQATALALFAKKGFDGATMRDIAKAAGVSLGAAYHYFPSKEAIALAFYREHLTRQSALTLSALRDDMSLRERLDVVFATALDVRGADRLVLAALARTVLDMNNPISLFSEETRDLRELSLGTLRRAVTCPEVEDDLRETLVLALWALQLGLLLRFVLDETPGQTATRRLMQGALDMVPSVVAVAQSPFGAPFKNQLLDLLSDAGFISSQAS
jgi:AcrR family transcriptional regulator